MRVAPALSAAERPLVARMWALRALAERRATARFARLAARLEDVGAPALVLEFARKAVDDERRHEALCAEMACSFGHDPITFPDTPTSEIGAVDRPRADRVLHEIIALCCVTESINAAMLQRSIELTEEPRSREATRAILRDEVDHARLGWGYLASRAADAPALGLRLPEMLDATTPAELLAPATHERTSPALIAHGVLPRSELRAILAEALAEVVLPGLERFGVEAAPGRAWLAERLPEG